MIKARYSDGRSAASCPVLVQSIGENLRIMDEQGHLLTTWPLARVSPPRPLPRDLRHEPLILRYLPPGWSPSDTVVTQQACERLTFSDESMARHMLEELRPHLSVGRGRRRRRWLAALTIIWLAVGLAWFGIPHLARQIAPLIPLSWERSLGDQTREQLAWLLTNGRKNAWVEPEGEGRHILDSLLDRLNTASQSLAGEQPEPLRVFVLDSGVVNAFAVPGGAVVVTTGLLDTIHGLDELAAVLAHEQAHVRLRHTTQQLLRGMAFQYLLDVAGGGSGYAGTTVAEFLVSMGWSREMEREADDVALQTLQQARISPQGFLRFFQRLEREGEGRVLKHSNRPGVKRTPEHAWDTLSSMLSTHPGFAERIRRIEALPAYPVEPLYGETFWTETSLRTANRKRGAQAVRL